MKFFRTAGAALIAGTMALIPMSAALALSDADKAEVQATIRAYILQNPEIIKEAIDALEKKQASEAEAAATRAVSERKEKIFDSPLQTVIGNPKGDVTLVEFFDYNCGYCRKALDDVNALIKDDPKLRVVLKEFPILSRGSMEAAQVAVAVKMQAPEKYMDFHNKLFAAREETGKPADKTQAIEVAREVGLDMARLEKDLQSPEIRATLEESYELAQALSVNGTPAFVVGEEVLHGAVGADTISGKIKAVRSCGKATC
jgi:protein-disulfide isomerase